MLPAETYIQKLIQYCTDFRFREIPAAEELLGRSFRLSDIFIPLRISEQLDPAFHHSASEPPEPVPRSALDTALRERLRESLEKREDADGALLAEHLDLLWSDPQLRLLLMGPIMRTRPSLDEILRTDRTGFPLQHPAASLFPEASEDALENRPIGPLTPGQGSRRVLLSPPGCGKSLLSRRIALAYAAHDKSGLELYDLPGELFPLLLLCRNLPHGSITPGTDFPHLAFRMLQPALPADQQDAFLAFLREKAEGEDLLLLVDGFDELLVQEDRQAAAQALLAFLEAYPRVHLLLTSRITSFSPDAPEIRLLEAIPHLRNAHLLPLNYQEIRLFVSRWYQLLFPDRVVETDQLLRQLTAFRSDTARLAQVPLHLSSLLIIAGTTGRLPEDRLQLFGDFLQIMLNRRPLGPYPPHETLLRLAYLAARLSLNHDVYAVLPSIQAILIQGELELGSALTVPLPPQQIEAFLQAVEEQTGLLQRSDWGGLLSSYAFPHLQIQEYLAAYGIAHHCVSASPEELLGLGLESPEIFCMLLPLSPRKDRGRLLDVLLDVCRSGRDAERCRRLLGPLLQSGVRLSASQLDRVCEVLFRDAAPSDPISFSCLPSDAAELSICQHFFDGIRTGEGGYEAAFGELAIRRSQAVGESPLLRAGEILLYNFGDDEAVSAALAVIRQICAQADSVDFFDLFSTVSRDHPPMGQLPADCVLRLLLLFRTRHARAACLTLEGLLSAGYITDFYDLFRPAAICAVTHFLTIRETAPAAERLLSVFPIGRSVLPYAFRIAELPQAQDLQDRCLRQLSGPLEEAVDALHRSLLLGCWTPDSPAFREALLDLSLRFRAESNSVSASCARHYHQLLEQLLLLNVPDSQFRISRDS